MHLVVFILSQQIRCIHEISALSREALWLNRFEAVAKPAPKVDFQLNEKEFRIFLCQQEIFSHSRRKFMIKSSVLI